MCKLLNVAPYNLYLSTLGQNTFNDIKHRFSSVSLLYNNHLTMKENNNNLTNG